MAVHNPVTYHGFTCMCYMCVFELQLNGIVGVGPEHFCDTSVVTILLTPT